MRNKGRIKEINIIMESSGNNLPIQKKSSTQAKYEIQDYKQLDFKTSLLDGILELEKNRLTKVKELGGFR